MDTQTAAWNAAAADSNAARGMARMVYNNILRDTDLKRHARIFAAVHRAAAREQIPMTLTHNEAYCTVYAIECRELLTRIIRERHLP